MPLFLCSLALLIGGGVVAFCAGKGRVANSIGSLSAACGSALALLSPLSLLAGAASGGTPVSWSTTLGFLPMGVFALRLDAFSAVFLLPVLLLSTLCAVYGGGSLASTANSRHLGAHWLFYNLLVAGMVLALTATDAFLFMLSWELMSVTPFFLISLHDETSDVRSAAWVYLMAAHLGALFLLAFFAYLSAQSGGSLSFHDFAASSGALAARHAGLLFILALIGFGAKIGLMPLHVWMPEAYSAAPTHISALMSGAAVNLGVYGLIRALSFIGPGQIWWACLLIGAGAFTGFVGILLALTQPGIKRSLAYSSVENMGIICIALGAGLFCLQHGQAGAAYLALTGLLLHMLNHALSKGLLFLCTGSVLHSAGTLNLRLLGGLQKRLPLVGCCFALGAAAISALPPLNGFAGEFFIYLSLTYGGVGAAQSAGYEYSLVFWFALFTLAGIGGFTLLCFTRVYAMAFLGEARSAATHTRSPSFRETCVLLILAGLCLLSTISSPFIARQCRDALPSLTPTAHAATPTISAAPALVKTGPLRGYGVSAPRPGAMLAPAPHLSKQGPEYSSAVTLLRRVNQAFLLFTLVAAALYLLRRRLLRGREVASSPTWGCAYIAPTARMQYTAGSFSQPAGRYMRNALNQKIRLPEITEYFPARARADMSSPDWIAEDGLAPIFRLVSRVADWCKGMQHGRLNGYVLYSLITLVALLAWELR